MYACMYAFFFLDFAFILLCTVGSQIKVKVYFKIHLKQAKNKNNEKNNTFSELIPELFL